MPPFLRLYLWSVNPARRTAAIRFSYSSGWGDLIFTPTIRPKYNKMATKTVFVNHFYVACRLNALDGRRTSLRAAYARLFMSTLHPYRLLGVLKPKKRSFAYDYGSKRCLLVYFSADEKIFRVFSFCKINRTRRSSTVLSVCDRYIKNSQNGHHTYRIIVLAVIVRTFFLALEKCLNNLYLIWCFAYF